MAELNVQRKENNIWPWVLAGVIALALLFWFMRDGDDRIASAAMNDTDTTMVGRTLGTDAMGPALGTADAGAVNQYLQFVEARSASAAGTTHEYTAVGLRLLAAALNEVASGDTVSGGVALRPRIEAIRERADALQQNPSANEHALQTREAFTLVSSLIAQMSGNTGTTGFTGAGNFEDLENAATAIEPSRPLLEQMERVEAFFEKAGEAVRKMSGNGAS